MKCFWLLVVLVCPSLAFAESFALNFKAVPLVQFAQATYKVMLKRDFVMSSELLAMEKTVSVSVSQISAEALPKLVERVLFSQGVRSVERDGVFYLGIESLDESSRSTGGQSFQLAGPLRSHASVGDRVRDVARVDLGLGSASGDRRADLGLDDEREVFRPLLRDADFVALALNAVFASKPAVAVSGVVVLSGSRELLKKVLAVAQGVDRAPSKVKVSATFVEVSTNDTKGMGVSVIANLLGVKLGLRLGDTSGGSLTLAGGSFQAVLDVLSADGRFRQVSNPTAVVDDYKKSQISFGDSVPTIGSTSLDKNGNPIQQVVYQPSGVLLDVTPRVLGSGKISLTLDGQVSSFAATTTGVTMSPTLSKRQVQTSLTLDDGEILVIGGLSNNKSVNSESGFSFLPRSWSVASQSLAATDLVLILSASVVQ